MSVRIPIIMGSKRDLEHGRAIAMALEQLGLEGEIRVASAHKATRFVLEMLDAYEASETPAYITVAGRSNALSGVVDANVVAPVIACPPSSSAFGGADIYSSLRMPSGVAPAVILEPANAALFVAKLVGTRDPGVRERVRGLQAGHGRQIEADDEELQRD